MNIQFFGHSICCKQNRGSTKTFADILLEKYNARTDTNGIAIISEERILYNIKKTKNIDIALVFHSEPSFYFMPTADRDFDKMPEKELIEKLSYGVPRVYPEVAKDKRMEDCEPVNLETSKFIDLLRNYQSYFITPDLLNQRFYGALIQIDQYLKAKNIPTIHCPYGPWTIPSWFAFTHGIVDNEISRMQFKHITDDRGNAVRHPETNNLTENPYLCSYNKSDNAINEEGNIIIAEKLSKYIDQLLS